MGLVAFRESVSGHDRVRDRLLRILLVHVALERQGVQIDRILLRHTIGMLVELGVQNRNTYKECFEDWFIDDAAKFYRNESLQYISDNTVPDFLRRAEQRIKEEKSRVHNYLHDSTQERIQQVMDKEWLLTHHEALDKKPDSGCQAMFHRDKQEDLRRLYLLFSRCPSTLRGVHRVMIECIKEAGKGILSDPSQTKDPVKFIGSLLELKDKYVTFVRESFHDSKEFQLSLKQAFEDFLNVDTQTAQNLSLYVDDLFRKKTTTSEGEVERHLDQVITIFRYLQDKDIFENFYKQYFAKRLLSGTKVVSEDHEKCILSKLKGECGHTYTQKLEGMFNDIKTSEELTQRFQQERMGGNRIDLKLNILTTGYWPTVTFPGPCTLPLPLLECVKVFEAFYNNKHQGRRLTWNHSQGQADLKALMPNNVKHEFNVSTYQMCILYCFNNADTLSYNDLLTSTKIPLEEFKRHLQSLYVHPKLKVLIKSSGGSGNPNDMDGSGNPNAAADTQGGKKSDHKKEPQDGDWFSLNPQFESKMFRVKIPLIQAKRDPSKDAMAVGESCAPVPGADMPSSVDEDRKHLTEATIVRIMKSRRTLEHNQLMVEVTKHLQSRFSPTPQLIKQRIEKLIEREYLERSTRDWKMYNYLA
eukprot:gene150-325_t